MTTEPIDTVEKAVMLVVGALVVIAMPVLGLLVTVTGSMSPMLTYTQGDSSGHALAAGGVPDGATIVNTPIIGPNARAMLIAAALVLLGFLAVYKLFAPSAGGAETSYPESTRN